MRLAKIPPLKIRDRLVIGHDIKPYIISEIGTNHNRCIETAKELIRQTALSGCSCAKFQIYEPYEIVSEKVRSGDYNLQKQYGDISARDIFELYLKTPKEWFPELIDFCHKLNLDCCFTIHGAHGFEWAKKLCPDIIKIASMDHTNLPFMEKLVNNINIPIIASFGMALLQDIDAAVKILGQHSPGFALFHCVAIYPPTTNDLNLNNISFLSKRFGLNIGFSDHTEDLISCVAALAQGACLFEKHLTLNKKQIGPDHKFALEPKCMKNFVKNLNKTHKALGRCEFNNPSKKELENRNLYLKSIIVKNDLPAGHILSKDDVYLARPGTGLSPKYLKQVLQNRRLVRNVFKEQPLSKQDIKLID